MKNFARKFSVANRILNKSVTTKGRKKPSEFSFWWINRNLCIVIRNLASNFFVENWILNKSVTNRGRKKPFESSFRRISQNLYIFMKNFARKFIVGNWLIFYILYIRKKTECAKSIWFESCIFEKKNLLLDYIYSFFLSFWKQAIKVPKHL